MKTRKAKQKQDVLVVYCFHIYNDRVKKFIKKALFKDDHVKFIVVCNDLELKIPVPEYVTYLNRENKGYDFGAWSHALLTNNLYENYDKFIFVNSSVDGPYNKGKWTDVYLNGLQNNVKLFGTTINCIKKINLCHVQSYIFCMNKETLKFLIGKQIFSLTELATTFKNAIWKKEVAMSRKIVEHGWNIGSLLSYYKGVDFTKPSDTIWGPDMMRPKYKNKSWTKKNLVFVKGNRIDCTKNCKK